LIPYREAHQPLGHHERVDRERAVVHRDRPEVVHRRPEPEDDRPDLERVPEQRHPQRHVGPGTPPAQEDVPVAHPGQAVRIQVPVFSR